MLIKLEIHNFMFNEEMIYMKKSISRIIGVIMLIVAIAFIIFASVSYTHLDVYKRQMKKLSKRKRLR